MGRNKTANNQKTSNSSARAVQMKEAYTSFKLSKVDKWRSLIVAIVAVVLYANTFGHEYVLDDHDIIPDNTHVQKGIDAIPTIFSTTIRNGAGFTDDYLYRPLSQAMFAIEWQIWPDNPHPSHVINVLLFALTCSVLFIALKHWTGNSYLSFVCSALFALHPIHTEVVANIKSRDEILGMLGIASTLLFYYRYLLSGQIKHILFAMITTAIAVFSKESSIIILLLLPLFIYFFTEKESNKIRTNRWKGLIFISAVIFIFLLIRNSIVGGLGAEDVAVADNFLFATDNIMDRKATAFYLMGYMLRILFVPHPLAIDYGYSDFNITSFSDPIVIVSVLIYLMIGGIIIKGLKNRSFYSFAGLFYLFTIALPSNLFIEIGTAFGERLLYVPSVAFCLLIAYLLTQFVQKEKEFDPTNIISFFKRLGAAGITLLVVGVLYSYKTISRNEEWKNELALFSADVKTRPNSAHMTYYYGNHITNIDFLSEQSPADSARYINEGIQYLKKSIKILELFPVAHHQLGYTYFKIAKRHHSLSFTNGKNKDFNLKQRDLYLDSAYISLKRSISIARKHIYFNTYGSWMFEVADFKGKKAYLDTSLIYIQKAVDVYPQYTEGWNNLGSVYGKMQQYDNAIAAFNKALEIEPDNETSKRYLDLTYQLQKAANEDHFTKGVQLIEQRDFQSAAIEFEKAIQTNPNSAELWTRLAWCYAETKRFQEAISALEKALQIDPNFARAYLFLGVTYNQIGKKELSLINSKKACELDPSLCQ